MVELGILEPCSASEWASLAFIIPKKDGFDKLLTYTHSIKQSFANNILYISSQICFIASLVTNYLPNLTFPCNTTHLNLMIQAKSFVSLSRLLANTNTNVFLRDSNVPSTLPSKSWKKYDTISTTQMSTLTTLVSSLSIGSTTFYFLTKSYIG